MGLDVVELMMDVEETFHITIEDDDYEEIRTVGDLHDLILKRVDKVAAPEAQRDRICLTSATFLTVRRALVSLFEIPRAAIRPSSPIDHIFPRDDRLKNWDRLRNTLDLKLPALQRPTWMVCALVAVATISVAAALWLHPAGIVGILALTVAAVGLLALLTHPFATEPGPQFATVGDLTQTLLQRNYRALHTRHIGWGRERVWETLKVIIVEQLGVSPEDVRPDARFVDDLRAD